MKKPSVVPVVLSGFCGFLPLYAPQPILPMLAGVFHASQVMISLIVTVATAGVALSAPFIGQVADRAGRKRVIVLSGLTLGAATLLTATSASLGLLLFWRFIQGIVTPGVFSVTTAYVHDEWPSQGAASAIAAYVSGTVIGGLSGRMIAGYTAEHWGWRWVFVVLGCIILLMAGYMALRLPAETKFARSSAPVKLLDAMAGHLCNPRLRAAYAIGFCVLFTQVALFTYVTFHLAAPPFLLRPGELGFIFIVYIAGAILTPVAGRRIGTNGHSAMLIFASWLAITGALLTLAPHLWLVLPGMALCCCGVFIAQAAATSFVGVAAPQNRGVALGLYVTFYYAGGSFGGVAPGWIWTLFNWPGCVALVVAVQMTIAGIARGMPHGGRLQSAGFK